MAQSKRPATFAATSAESAKSVKEVETFGGRARLRGRNLRVGDDVQGEGEPTRKGKAFHPQRKGEKGESP